MVRLIGPGGAGKSTIAALLAERLNVTFLDLDRYFADRVGDIGDVRRQVGRPFGRSATKEEDVIRARFEIYMAVPARKIETMRPVAATVDEIIAALPPQGR